MFWLHLGKTGLSIKNVSPSRICQTSDLATSALLHMQCSFEPEARAACAKDDRSQKVDQASCRTSWAMSCKMSSTIQAKHLRRNRSELPPGRCALRWLGSLPFSDGTVYESLPKPLLTTALCQGHLPSFVGDFVPCRSLRSRSDVIYILEELVLTVGETQTQ